MSEKLFKITLTAGSIMMVCLVLLMIIPCYITAALYAVSTLTTAVTGLLSNLTSKEHTHGDNKFINRQ